MSVFFGSPARAVLASRHRSLALSRWPLYFYIYICFTTTSQPGSRAWKEFPIKSTCLMEAIGTWCRVVRVRIFDAVLVCSDNGFRKRASIKKKDEGGGKGGMKNIVVMVRERTRQRDALPASTPMGWPIGEEKSCLVSMKVTLGGIRLCTLEPKTRPYRVDKITSATVSKRE